MSTNNFGGQDRDFCQRAVGTQPVLIVAHACPQCLFPGYSDDFEGKTEIPDEVAALFKEGKIKPSVALPKDAGKKVPADEVRLADELTSAKEAPPERLWFALVLYRAHGENPLALNALSRLEPLLEKDLAAKLGTSLRESVELERHYQNKLLPHLKAALEAADKEEKPAITYLYAEILRRLERWEESLSYFEKVEGFEEVPDGLEEWPREQKQRLIGTKKARQPTSGTP